jgi:hypothetical protein
MLCYFESKGLKAKESTQLMGLDSASALVRRGDYITRRQQERQVLQSLDEDPTRPRYSAGRSTYPLVRIDDKQATLTCRGVICDVIDEMHDEPFPSDIEAEWQNATIFMVAVRGSKKRASDHPNAVQRYPLMHQRMRAFWSTLMVGMEQRVDSDITRYEEEFTGWLPELNGTWCTAAPPLTHITSGLVGLSEVGKVQLETVERHASSSFRLGPSSWTAIVDGADPKDEDVRRWNLTRESSLTPRDWTCAEISHYREQFDWLGNLWHKQPYDLYHRPFSLLNVVPDPYWHSRKEHDELAKSKSRNFRAIPMMAPASVRDDEDVSEFDCSAFKQSFEDQLKSTPSIIPQGTLQVGLEKYALGRGFLITKKGYFGLGPGEVHNGHRVAIIFDQDVPIILRRSSSETDRPT